VLSLSHLNHSLHFFCRKPCSGYKLNEMSGSSIFNGQDGESESGGANPNNRTTVRVYQVLIW